MQLSNKQVSRRTLAKGAAWSMPVVAVAVAAPNAVASPATSNGTANYYWDSEATGSYTQLDPADSGNRAQFSTQISYQSTPWVGPPNNGVLVVVVTFSKSVTIRNLGGTWTADTTGPATTFTFMLSPSSFGGGLTFDVVAGESGELTSSASMSVQNPTRDDGSDASWAPEASTASATLVA